MFSKFSLYQASKPTVNPLLELAQFEQSYLRRYGKLPNFAMVNPRVFENIERSSVNGLTIAPRKNIAANNIALAFDDALAPRPVPCDNLPAAPTL